MCPSWQGLNKENLLKISTFVRWVGISAAVLFQPIRSPIHQSTQLPGLQMGGENRARNVYTAILQNFSSSDTV